MPNYETVLYEKQRNGVLITLNRPETLNAISRQLERDVSEALTEGRERSRGARHRPHRRRPRIFFGL